VQVGATQSIQEKKDIARFFQMRERERERERERKITLQLNKKYISSSGIQLNHLSKLSKNFCNKYNILYTIHVYKVHLHIRYYLALKNIFKATYW